MAARKLGLKVFYKVEGPCVHQLEHGRVCSLVAIEVNCTFCFLIVPAGVRSGMVLWGLWVRFELVDGVSFDFLL